ncbi:MAG: diacylglycerol kinase [Bacteroidetes bacterium]|nr:diacylglycerol kinase [Bacteroidota bacterium]
MKYCVIHNPHAGAGRGEARARRCLALFSRGGAVIDDVEIRRFEEAFSLSREANLAGYDAVVAIGGDGTINKVLNGFFDGDGRRISSARFGVVHTGTSPDFCRSYGLPLDPEGAVEVLLRGRVRSIPVGQIRFHAYDRVPAGEAGGVPSPHANSCFVCCANIGLGAALATRASSGIRGRFGDRLGTFLSLLQVLRSHEPEDFRLLVDGEEVLLSRVYNISIGLTEYIASGIRVHNAAMRERGLFYMMTLRDLRAGSLPSVLRKIYSGRPFDDSAELSLRACARIDIPSHPTPADVEHDGDACGHVPCSIERTAEGLELLC